MDFLIDYKKKDDRKDLDIEHSKKEAFAKKKWSENIVPKCTL